MRSTTVKLRNEEVKDEESSVEKSLNHDSESHESKDYNEESVSHEVGTKRSMAGKSILTKVRI